MDDITCTRKFVQSLAPVLRNFAKPLVSASVQQLLSSILLEIRRGENPRSQNRPSKTRRGAAESGFAGPVLGPWIEPSLISY